MTAIAGTVVSARELAGFFAGIGLERNDFGVGIWNVRGQTRMGLVTSRESWRRW